MKIEFVPMAVGSDTLLVKLSHGTESSEWDVKAYSTKTGDRSEQLSSEVIFREINNYWASKPMEVQAAIWGLYKEIRDLLDTNYEIRAIQQRLTRYVSKLYQLMPIEDIFIWLRMNNMADIRMPQTLTDEHLDPNRVRRTYLKKDYQQLVTLAIALRAMLPIWGEFLDKAKAESGTPFKEYSALGLLYHSSVINSEPMERLRVYIKASLEESPDYKVSAAAVLHGLGTEELPEWLLGLTAVRRLTIGEISAREDNSSLISNIWQFITHQIRQLDRKFQGRVSDKPNPQAFGDENKTSVAEQYKIKQEVADGDVVTINVYTERVMDMAMRVDPTLPEELLQACQLHVRALEPLSVEKHQVALAQWVMKACIQPQGIPLLSKPALLRVLAITQAALWHWGFFDLASLVTVTRLQHRKDEMRQSLESRGRVPKELLEELLKRYPHYQIGRKQFNDRQRNPAYITIDAFCTLITEADWLMLAPPALIEQSTRVPNTKRFIVPMDIRSHLARLFLKIAH